MQQLERAKPSARSRSLAGDKDPAAAKNPDKPTPAHIKARVEHLIKIAAGYSRHEHGTTFTADQKPRPSRR